MSKDTPFCRCNQCVPPSTLMKVLGATGKALLGMLLTTTVLVALFGIIWVLFYFPTLTMIVVILAGAALAPALAYSFYVIGRDAWNAIRGKQ